MKQILVVSIVAFVMLFAVEAKAGVITSVVNNNSNDSNDVYAIGTLAEDVTSFIDRSHQYNDIPTSLLGIDFVQVANDDKTSSNLSIDVVVNTDSWLYLFIDNRISGALGGGGTMSWVTDNGFIDSLLDIGIDESGDGDIDQTSSIYHKMVSAGTTTTLAQNDGGSRNMYGIAAASAVPEPSVAALFALGLLGLGFARRRKA